MTSFGTASLSTEQIRTTRFHFRAINISDTYLTLECQVSNVDVPCVN
jgi:hypothetical protein